MKNNLNFNRGEKIILFLYEISKGEKKKFLYEDIVVGLFSKYPEDFHLKGYSEFPDSSDSTQRILYQFKKKGFITATNKIFSLTDGGLELGHQLSKNPLDHEVLSDRFSRSTNVEVDRIKKLEGFILYIEGKAQELTDSDFYNYLGITARTSASMFLGRFNTINEVIKDLKQKPDDPIFSKIIAYNDFLFLKCKSTIDYFLKK